MSLIKLYQSYATLFFYKLLLAMKTWSPRFTKPINEKMLNFNQSISFDYKLAKYDIIASIAHAKMLRKVGLLSEEELKIALKGLKKILKQIEDNEFEFNINDEDIHYCIQNALIKEIGEIGKKIHTARSRNDQVATDLRLYTREHIDLTCTLLTKIINILKIQSEKYKDCLMCGYTHLQKAIPTTFGNYLDAYKEMFEEDFLRLTDCRKRVNISPLGACSICGTTLPQDREFTAKELEFDGYIKNTMNAVSNRDFIIEVINAISIISIHFSRFAEDIIIYSTEEFGFVELDDAFCTGSSLMPNKKNPDLLELIRGKTGRIFGCQMAILTILKGVPMTYNKDFQEDKKNLFEAFDIIEEITDIMCNFIPTIKINKENMQKAVKNSYSYATHIVDYLVNKGEYFRNAHSIVSSLVKYCESNKKYFHELKIEEYKQFSDKFCEDLFKIFKFD